MKSVTHLRTITLVAALGLGLTLAAHAAGQGEAEALNKAAVSLAQATQIAEKQDSGKTIAAEFDIEKGRPLWEIRVLGTESPRFSWRLFS